MKTVTASILIHRPIRKRIGIMVCLMLLIGATQFVEAQTPIRHNAMRGDLPPGVAGDMARMQDPSLDSHLQPVRVIAPDGTLLEIGVDQGFINVNASRVSLGMFVGPVYRLKISNIPQHWDKQLYPSVEILGKLNPPEELKNEFPIEVVISGDDLKQAIDGNMVTKVVYLEDPDNALPHKHLANQQPFFDVGPSTDPMRAARKLGRPIAILRIGSRIPTSNDRAEFNFHAPEPQLLPEPQMTVPNPKWEEPVEFQPLRMPQRNPFNNPVIPGNSSVPIVPGEVVPNSIVPGQITPQEPQRVPGQVETINLNDQALLPGQSILRR